MAPAQKPLKKDNSKAKMGEKETTMKKKETAVEKKETAVEKKETTMKKKETTMKKKETTMKKKVTAVEKNETSVEKNETSVEKKESSVEKKEPVKKLKQRKYKSESYASYIYKVLKQVHPGTEMSKQAMSIMDSFMQDIFERIAAESSSLTKNNGRKVLSSHDVQTAVRIIFPGELSKHATVEGAKALQYYKANK